MSQRLGVRIQRFLHLGQSHRQGLRGAPLLQVSESRGGGMPAWYQRKDRGVPLPCQDESDFRCHHRPERRSAVREAKDNVRYYRKLISGCSRVRGLRQVPSVYA